MIATAEKPKKEKAKRMRGRVRADVVRDTAAVIEGPSSGKPPALSAGTKLVRQFKGRKLVVVVLEDGRFEHAGKIYRSLSKLANELSGQHVSGPRWFGLVGKKKEAKS